MLIPVIMSGGAGTRLWPVSRQLHPKPFMLLPDGNSIIQSTLLRTVAIEGVTSVLTITNRDLYFNTRDEYDVLEESDRVSLDYLLEPCGRNTAPAIAAAALYLLEKYDDAVMFVMPADHVIRDYAAFSTAAKAAGKLAEQGKLVTFGIKPDKAETGFGYIRRGEKITEADAVNQTGYKVDAFVEKPDLETARQYLASADYLWNAGMFCFKPAVLLEEMAKHCPEVHDGVNKCWQASKDNEAPIELDKALFSQVPDISIDYAVMEKSDAVAVVACDYDWSDIGSWQAFGDLIDADKEGNRVVGEAVMVRTSNTYINSGHHMVTTVGVDNLIIVDTPDALLVGHKDQIQHVKEVVQSLKQTDEEIVKRHRTVHRPWGTYTVLEEGPRFKIKRIVVKPGATLSLQYHHHRSEHWVVVSGTARVDDGEKETLVQTNESTYIPIGKHHRLSNPGVTDLHMIEVQCGEYLGEDDIVRIEDKYGRKK